MILRKKVHGGAAKAEPEAAGAADTEQAITPGKHAAPAEERYPLHPMPASIARIVALTGALKLNGINSDFWCSFSCQDGTHFRKTVILLYSEQFCFKSNYYYIC